MTDQLTRIPEQPAPMDGPKPSRWRRLLTQPPTPRQLAKRFAVVVVLGLLLGTAFAVGSTLERTEHNQTRAELADVSEHNAELWQRYATCRSAAEHGHALNDAWHAWNAEKTQEAVDLVHKHQSALHETLAACESGTEGIDG